jgi:hypothetical protein
MGTFKWSVMRRDSVSILVQSRIIPNPLTGARLDPARRVLRAAQPLRPTWVSCSTRWRAWPVSSVEEFSVATATYQRLPFPNDSIPLYRCDLLSHLAAIPTGVDGTVRPNLSDNIGLCDTSFASALVACSGVAIVM